MSDPRRLADGSGYRTTSANFLQMRSARPSVNDEADCDTNALKRQRLSQLARTIESDVIPRLLNEHPVDRGPGPCAPRVAPMPTDGDLQEFTTLVLRQDRPGAVRIIKRLEAAGVGRREICLHLLAPCARRFGEYWVDDQVDFTDVTIGLLFLHEMLREISSRPNENTAARERRALLTVVPNEQHIFGLSMIAEFFLQDGWSVDVCIPESLDELAAAVQRKPLDIVGLSCSCDVHLDAAAACIRAIRCHAGNGVAGVLVGGQFFGHRPDLVGELGADATAPDGPRAVLRAARLVEERLDRI